MREQAFLLDIAKIAISFMGFTTVVIAVRHRDAEPWAEREVAGVLFMIEHAMAATFAGLLPVFLFGVADAATVWQIVSAALGLFLVGELLAQVVRGMRTVAEKVLPTHPLLLLLTYVMPAFVLAVLLIVNATRWRGAAVVLATCILLLFWSCMQFWVFIAGTRRPAAAKAAP